MDTYPSPFFRLRWAAALTLVLATGLACNEHDLAPYSAAVRSADVVRAPAFTRPIDVLFVIDDSGSMCEEQATLERNFNQFVDILDEANADYRLAVVTTDMASVTGGQLKTSPGDFDQQATCPVLPDVTSCPDTLPRFLDSRDYEDRTRLVSDFGCLALAGVQGSSVEMGLSAMRAALEADATLPENQRFVRDDAFLAVVFVTDENDCSDGTRGFEAGPVYPDALDATNAACELSRNIEDSCLFSEDSPGPTLEYGGEEKTAHQWCISGNRDAVQALRDQIMPDCPPGGCENQLQPRKDFYDFLVSLKQTPEGQAPDVIVATIINQDGGVRYGDASSVTDWCGVGKQGYRYELFARMFPESRRVIAPICDLSNDEPVDFAEELRRLAEIIVDELSGTCGQNMPMTCTADGPGEGGSCPAGEVCCPGGQTCETQQYNVGEGFYRICSGARVDVSIARGPDAPFMTLERGSYQVDWGNKQCFDETDGRSPIKVTFDTLPLPDWRIELIYPTSVAPVFEE